jgi:hypothetical protein
VGATKSRLSVMTKIGRNSPCPCGSGKKYKRCCQAKEAHLVRPVASLPNGPGSFDSFIEEKSTSRWDEKIEQVSRVLSEWNPLGDRANTIPDLEGYRIEAIDILFNLRLFGSANPSATVQDILNQAFDLSLPIDECHDAARKIASIFETK